MSCNSLENIIKSCDPNVGGIYTAYIFDMEDIDTYTESTSTWSVSSLVLANLTPALNFEFKRNTSEYLDEAQIDLIAGTNFYKKTINLMFHRREALKSKAIKILGEGQRYLGVVIGDAMGQYWYFPYMQLSADTGGSGKAKGDGSNYNITLAGEDLYPAKSVSAIIAASLLIPNS